MLTILALNDLLVLFPCFEQAVNYSFYNGEKPEDCTLFILKNESEKSRYSSQLCHQKKTTKRFHISQIKEVLPLFQQQYFGYKCSSVFDHALLEIYLPPP